MQCGKAIQLCKCYLFLIFEQQNIEEWQINKINEVHSMYPPLHQPFLYFIHILMTTDLRIWKLSFNPSPSNVNGMNPLD